MATPEFLICQVCGLGSAVDTMDSRHWLVSEHRTRPGLWIIRCPRHISEWAMRNSSEGRTKQQRAKAEYGRTVWPTTRTIPQDVTIEPLPPSWGRVGAESHRSEGESDEQK